MELVLSVARHQKRRRGNPKVPVALGWTTTTLDDLCDSLLIQILSRLPLKQVKRCLAVSKRWHALISDPFFVRLFGEKRKSFAFLLNYYQASLDKAVSKLLVISNEPDDFKSQGFTLSFLPCFLNSPAVLASCNDLLLCCDNQNWQEFYYICNPFTLSRVQLPRHPPPYGKFNFGVGLVCENSYSIPAATSSTSSCRYTVLRAIQLGPDASNEFKFKVQIFSSDVGEWRENVVSCGQRAFVPPLQRRNAIYYNGLLYFLNHGDGLMGLDPYEGGELRHFIDLPKEFFDYHFRCFGVCEGRLRLFQVSCHPNPFVRVWDLKDYERGEWIMEKQVRFCDMSSKSCSWVIEEAKTPHFLPRVIACDPDDGDVVYFIANQGRLVYKIVSCNMRMRILEEVCDLPWDIKMLDEVITYKPSWYPTPISPPKQSVPLDA